MRSNPVVACFILWAIRRTRRPQPIVTFSDDPLFTRYEFLWPDEWPDHLWDQYSEDFPVRPNQLPWWRPFNAFLHVWHPAANLREDKHDYPRWSITICLRGRIIERTPWGERLLKPGSIVIRSHRAIHSFEVPQGFRGKTWTLFIVGRRKHRQNTYEVLAR